MFRIEKVVANTHPELGVYSRTTWRVNKMSYDDFKRALSNKNGFFDVRIEKNGEMYSIILKGVNGPVVVNAKPVRMNLKKKISEYSSRNKCGLYKAYCRLLKLRERSFDKQIARELKRARKVSAPGKRDEMAWKGAKYIITNEESAKPLVEWKVYVAEEQKAERKISDAMAANSSNIIRSFSIDGMGIWNCDQIQRLKDPVTVLARYNGKGGEKVKATGTYVVDKNLNAVLQYYGDEISFSPVSDNVFIIIKPDGELAYTTSAELKERSFANKQHYVFTLNEVNASATTVEELRKLIGM